MSYVEQWMIQSLSERSDLIDEKFARLCSAKKANIFNRPIYWKFWDYNNPDDMISRQIDPDELCQCCETKLAKMVHGARTFNRSGTYELVDNL